MSDQIKGPNDKYCTECGSIIDAKAEFCQKCGARQMYSHGSIDLAKTAPNGKSRIAAALLAFFLGGIGVHKFYLGQIGFGILYLLFCWTFIPAIIAIIDFIFLIVMSDEKFNLKYGQI